MITVSNTFDFCPLRLKRCLRNRSINTSGSQHRHPIPQSMFLGRTFFPQSSTQFINHVCKSRMPFAQYPPHPNIVNIVRIYVWIQYPTRRIQMKDVCLRISQFVKQC